MRMHADEVVTDVDLVRRLLAAQFPQWAGLPLERVPSSGTVNALYRLGDDRVVRLPRRGEWAPTIERELEWLPQLAPLLPVAIPLPVARGAPTEEYEWPWAVYAWLDGETPPIGGLTDVASLVRFVAALHAIELDGPAASRGPLPSRDEPARAALEELEGVIDTRAATAAWEEALRAPPWRGGRVWTHGDLLPGNLLVSDGRLTAVLDWGGAGIGDPASDLLVAWAALPALLRDAFRAGLAVDDAMWARGRGWALSVALIALPYYELTNPRFADLARHMIREVLTA